MARSKTSRAWMREHVTDPYVKRAVREGMRSRAVFKLEEINARDKLIRPGMWVVDLGAAPGGWSQFAAPLVGPQGKVLALDLLEMEPIPGVEFIQGDFREQSVLEQLEQALEGRRVDLVLSDMAPNISGVRVSDQAQWAHLFELAVEFSKTHLQPEGTLLVKCFEGSGVDEMRREVGALFKSVSVRKPKASRDRSREFFLLAKGLRNGAGRAA